MAILGDHYTDAERSIRDKSKKALLNLLWRDQEHWDKDHPELAGESSGLLSREVSGEQANFTAAFQDKRVQTKSLEALARQITNDIEEMQDVLELEQARSSPEEAQQYKERIERALQAFEDRIMELQNES